MVGFGVSFFIFDQQIDQQFYKIDQRYGMVVFEFCRNISENVLLLIAIEQAVGKGRMGAVSVNL